ncbi:MAG: helix-turn-helix transcriptional regulator [Firmicutes bacterium]|nr:helix-turn-helix transcriptional regulator [Bacillota bacterium]
MEIINDRIGDRIKKIRQSNHLTQEAFGNRIGSARNTISNYEMCKREPSKAIITLICKEFNVNEEWLHTGKGEMSFPIPEEDETAALMSELLLDTNDEIYTLIKDILKAYINLDEKSKLVLKQFARSVFDSRNKNKDS